MSYCVQIKLAFLCKNMCDNLNFDGDSNKLSYENGFRWCSCCCVYLRIDDPRCPCCNITLRTSPKIKVKQ